MKTKKVVVTIEVGNFKVIKTIGDYKSTYTIFNDDGDSTLSLDEKDFKDFIDCLTEAEGAN